MSCSREAVKKLIGEIGSLKKVNLTIEGFLEFIIANKWKDIRLQLAFDLFGGLTNWELNDVILYALSRYILTTLKLKMSIRIVDSDTNEILRISYLVENPDLVATILHYGPKRGTGNVGHYEFKDVKEMKPKKMTLEEFADHVLIYFPNSPTIQTCMMDREILDMYYKLYLNGDSIFEEFLGEHLMNGGN